LLKIIIFGIESVVNSSGRNDDSRQGDNTEKCGDKPSDKSILLNHFKLFIVAEGGNVFGAVGRGLAKGGYKPGLGKIGILLGVTAKGVIKVDLKSFSKGGRTAFGSGLKVFRYDLIVRRRRPP